MVYIFYIFLLDSTDARKMFYNLESDALIAVKTLQIYPGSPKFAKENFSYKNPKILTKLGSKNVAR